MLSTAECSEGAEITVAFERKPHGDEAGAASVAVPLLLDSTLDWDRLTPKLLSVSPTNMSVTCMLRAERSDFGAKGAPSGVQPG